MESTEGRAESARGVQPEKLVWRGSERRIVLVVRSSRANAESDRMFTEFVGNACACQ